MSSKEKVYFEYFELDEELAELIDKLEKTKDRVEFVLKHVPDARDDDKLLWFMVNWVFNRKNLVKLAKLILWLDKNYDSIPYDRIDVIKKVLSKLISEDTISRCRRKIQNDEGKYPPSWDVEEERRRKERIWRKVSKIW